MTDQAHASFLTAAAAASLPPRSAAFAPGAAAARRRPPSRPGGAAPAAGRACCSRPSPIDRMQADNVVAVKGSVAEIFGNKFILQDDSGRALVEPGPRARAATSSTKGERSRCRAASTRGFIVAQVVSHADGRNEAFGPPRATAARRATRPPIAARARRRSAAAAADADGGRPPCPIHH